MKSQEGYIEEDNIYLFIYLHPYSYMVTLVLSISRCCYRGMNSAWKLFDYTRYLTIHIYALLSFPPPILTLMMEIGPLSDLLAFFLSIVLLIT